MSLRQKLWTGLLLLSLAFSWGGPGAVAPALAQDAPAGPYLPPQAPQAVVDSYGYTVSSDTITNTGWIDAGAGTRVNFTNPDDGYNNDQDGTGKSIPISLGFSFPYYEFNYSGVFITTNGQLTFGSGSVLSSNERLPSATPPNAIIAAFWDDLYVGGPGGGINQGVTYYLRGGSAPNRFFVVEWRNISRLSEGSNLLTFEIVLHENGQIDFRYQDLNGSLNDCTVGIEDSDGVDGVEYLYNQAGLAEGLVLRFNRPAADWRAKMVTPYNSAFIEDGMVRIPLLLRNSGQKGSDVYNFSLTSSRPAWQMTILGPDGSTRLSDTDGDSRQDTGALAQGADFALWVQVKAPLNAPLGDFAQVTLTVRSKSNPARTAAARLDTAVPAPFAFAFSDQRGIRLGYISSHAQAFPEVQTNYTGSALAIENTASNGLFYTWEKNITSNLGAPITNVEFALFTRFGRLQQTITRITNHEASAVPIFDLNPTTVKSEDGKIAIAWLRDNNGVHNIFFTVLSPQGEALFAPTNLTNQSGADVLFGPPLLTTTKVGNENHFVVVWTGNHQITEEKDVWSAGFMLNAGSQPVTLHAAAALTDSASSGAEFQDPQLSALSDGRVAVVYSKTIAGVETIEVLALDANGSRLAGAPLVIPAARGTKKDIVQIVPGGALGVAWVDSVTDQIRFSIVNAALTSAQPPTSLDTPNSRNAGEPSLARTADNRVIVHWLDDGTFGFLYYALLDASGTLITPPLVYRQAQQAEALNTSTNGQGVLSLSGFSHINLPVIRK